LPRRCINTLPLIQPILIQFLAVKTGRRFYPDIPFNRLSALGTRDYKHFLFAISKNLVAAILFSFTKKGSGRRFILTSEWNSSQGTAGYLS
jgi:hypothetical protein